MPDERITVDDALISTDVDRLIKVLSQRRHADMRQLEQATNLDRKSIEKWLHVLEDEGYITIDYRLTNVVVAWTGPESEANVNQNHDNFTHQRAEVKPTISKPLTAPPSISPPPSPPPPFVPQELPVTPPTVLPTAPVSPLPSSLPSLTSTIESPPESVLPDSSEKTLEDTLAELSKPAESIDSESDIKSSILESLEDTFKETEQETEAALPVSGFEEKTLLYGGVRGERKPGEGEKLKRIRGPPEMETEEKEEAVEAPEELPESAFVLPRGVRETLGSYMGEINRQKQEIARLKEQKDKLYREGYAPLESRMATDIAALTERILEKETRILELKEQLLDLPDRVEEVERLARKADRIRLEGRKNLEGVQGRIRRFLDDVEKTGNTLGRRMEESRRTLDEGKQRGSELVKLNRSLDTQMEEMHRQISDTQTHVDELGQKVKGMLGEVEKIGAVKDEILQMGEQVASAVESKEGEIEGLMRSLDEVRKVGQWMREYVEDYEGKVAEIEDYVGKSEEELAKIREAAETEYMRRYLRELQGLTEEYQGEFRDTMETEKDIDRRIETARQRLKKLILDSQETVHRLTRPVPPEEQFSHLVKRAKEKGQEQKQKMEEKDREYDKLLEDIKRAKDGRKRKGGEKKKGKKK